MSEGPIGGSVETSTRRRLRLAYLTTAYPEVSHTFIRREILELERRGHRVTRLSVRRPHTELVDARDRAERDRTRYILERRIELLFAAVRTALLSPRRCLGALRVAVTMAARSDRGWIRHAAYLAEACWVARTLIRDRSEHLHVHFGTNAAAVALLARRLGGPPYSVTIHGPDELDAPVGLALANKVAESAFTVAISHFCAAQLRRWVHPADWSRIHIVRCTIGTEFELPAEPIPHGSRQLICVGRLSPQKGQVLLLDAAAELAAAGDSFRLVLAGDGEMRGLLEAGIRSRGLEEHVEITGWLSGDEVRKRLVESRALVLPSSAEGLPVVIMEAFALGRPVLSTHVAGIPELVESPRSGWLVPVGDVDALVAAMRAVLTAPIADLEARAAVGRARTLERHGTRRQVDRLEACIEASAREVG